MDNNIEIEKKYIILKPRADELSAMADYSVSEIEQIYLSSPQGITHRVRSRKFTDRTVFTETTKVRIDKMSAYENEREITESEFESLSERRDEKTRAIKKHRHTFVFSGQLFEIDVYPEWKNTAILETELADRNTAVEFPSFLKIVSDVTGDKRYSNASMSRSFPEETAI